MKNRTKIYEHTAKLIKCSNCGSKMTEVNAKTHNSRAMYKLDKDDYLCASTKCTKSYMTERFHRYENEGDNIKPENQREVQLLRELGQWDLLKKYWDIDK